MTDESPELLSAVKEIRDLLRVMAEPAMAEHDKNARAELRRIVGTSPKKAKAVYLMEEALPDSKSRSVYQMSDGAKTTEQIRVACKVSPNYVVSLTQKCVSMGIMEQKPDKKRVRLFDLRDFGLNPTGNPSED